MMTALAVLGPAEYVLLVAVVAALFLAFWNLSRLFRSYRQIDECHQMLSELLREKREHARRPGSSSD